jgi:hypothetical protein
MIYTVKNSVVENPKIVYNDGVTKVYLYTKGTKGGNDNLRALLNFMENSSEENAVDSDLCKIQGILDVIRNNEEVGERYMTWEDVIEYEKRDSYEAGMETGFIKACREFGKSNDEIIHLLIEKFSLSKEEATEKVTNN